MDRKEVYKKIKSLKLEEKVKEDFGRNFTQVSTLHLISVINNYTGKAPQAKEAQNKVDKLIEILAKKRILLSSEVKALNNL